MVDLKREELLILGRIWHMLILPDVELHLDDTVSFAFILVFRMMQSQMILFMYNGNFLYVAETRLIHHFS